jgi:hypothetical protein
MTLRAKMAAAREPAAEKQYLNGEGGTRQGLCSYKNWGQSWVIDTCHCGSQRAEASVDTGDKAEDRLGVKTSSRCNLSPQIFFLLPYSRNTRIFEPKKM